MRNVLLASLVALLVAACGPVRNDDIDGPYRIWATDDDRETTVAYDLGDGAIGRIPPRVVAVGHNASFITAEVRPDRGDDVVFYYIVRELDGPLVDPSVSVRGPLSAIAFDHERSRLGLPVPQPID